MMKLHWSPRSPYVRKVMVALHEKGLADRIETVRTYADPLVVPQDFLPVNPLAKIPTLELSASDGTDGVTLYDSRVIMEWADGETATGPQLFPANCGARLLALRDEALGSGILDIGMTLLIETRLRTEPMQDARIIAASKLKLGAVLAQLEAYADRLGARDFDVGHIAIGVALCYLDFRFADLGWRDGRPHLAAWFETFRTRPSVIATEFRDDPRPAG